MKKYQIYGVGAALVDTEVLVTNEFLSTHKINSRNINLCVDLKLIFVKDAINKWFNI